MIGRDHVHYAGHMVGRTDKTRQHLLERQTRGLLLVAHVDEYLSSQVGHEKKRRGGERQRDLIFLSDGTSAKGNLMMGFVLGAPCMESSTVETVTSSGIATIRLLPTCI